MVVPPNPAVFDEHDRDHRGRTDDLAAELDDHRTGTGAGHRLAALIYPTPGCLGRPREPFGPYAGGNTVVPLGFTDHITLSASIWTPSRRRRGRPPGCVAAAARTVIALASRARDAQRADHDPAAVFDEVDLPEDLVERVGGGDRVSAGGSPA